LPARSTTLSPLIDPDQARVRLFDAVTTVLRRAATQQALVVVLDNLHWADKPSLLLLEFLMRELAQSRLLIIGTYRNIELSRRHPLSETLAELTRASLFQRALLKGLSREDVERFIRLATDSVPPPTLAAVLHAQTEGNPLYLTELVRLWYGQSRRIWRTRRGTS
jgi:predicted ATPase